MTTKPSQFALMALLMLTSLFFSKKGYGQNTDSLSKKLNLTADSLTYITNQIEQLDIKSQQLSQDIIKLTTKQNKTQAEIDTLEKKKQDLLKNNEASSKKNKELSDQASILIIQIDSIQKELAKVDSTKKDLEKKTNDLQKLSEGFNAVIAKELDSLEVIGTIRMRDSIRIWKRIIPNKNDTIVTWEGDTTIKIKKKPRNIVIDRAKITKVHLSVKEGVLIEIIVTTDFGTFRNKHASIDMLHFGDRGKDHLYLENQVYKHGGEDMFIFLDDAIVYAPLKSYLDVPYAEFDITLLPSDSIFLLRESTSINTYFNIAAFTDIKGISGEPNGLAQFTADAKFITRTRNFKETSMIPFSYISFRGAFAKFDNDFKGAQLYNNDSISRKDLLQRATYVVGVKMNLLRSFPSTYPKHLFNDIQFNVGYSFIGTKIFDTSFKDQARTVIDTTYKTVTQNQFYFEPQVTLNRHRNFAMTLAMPLFLNSVKKSSGIKNNGSEYWICPSINLMYYGKRDVGSKIFFRYNHFINLKGRTEAFSQMQLGYSVNLTQVLSGSSNNNK